MSIVIRKSHDLGMSITHFVSCGSGKENPLGWSHAAFLRHKLTHSCNLQEPNTGNSGGAPGPRDGDPGVSDDEQSHHCTSRSRVVATVTGGHHAISQRQEPSPRPYRRECDEAPVITTVRPTV
ncbi:hypothetical protein PCASD_04981 [Puccinia coronata f. sp. avenae]|uniref:Uncharacterized protein n=1 Tax=Puccinia coronata f. sp. avenae TaxID=200324 RepID=A0A2N5VD27_9BASI|nr:hypothetical protein PCASD_04981 [Puccinia coronata f. sp. avenae]